jgi:hypothetical protein
VYNADEGIIMNVQTDRPEAILLAIKLKDCVFLVTDPKDGLWTFPGGIVRESGLDPIQFATSCLYPYLDDLKVDAMHYIFAPEEKMMIDDRWVRCSIYRCRASGTARLDKQKDIWYVPFHSIVLQVLTPDIRGLLGCPELEAHLSEPRESRSHLR